jgi:hypothetical protein
MLTRAPRCDMTGAASPWTVTPPMSSPPSSRAPPAKDDEPVGRYRAPASPNPAGSARVAASPARAIMPGWSWPPSSRRSTAVPRCG